MFDQLCSWSLLVTVFLHSAGSHHGNSCLNMVTQASPVTWASVVFMHKLHLAMVATLLSLSNMHQ